MKFLALIGLASILTGIGAAIFFLGGYYSVSTTAAEPRIVHWLLVKVRTASIERHAKDAPPKALVSTATLRAGARAFFERGCTNCHGGPGIEWARFSEGLRPDPPDLKELANERTPAQFFWVIKNGINMTGMPGFGAAPDQEIWSIVAFLKTLPTVSDEDFKAWSGAANAAAAPKL
jgi:mono/diheme cytochrome c family protein